MSNYHILTMAPKEHEADVVFHIAVPNENNSAIPTNVNLQNCVSAYIANNDNVTAVPWLEADNYTEYQQIINGEIYEKKDTIKFNANITLAQKRDIIDARYTVLSTNLPDQLRSVFKFWGSNRDVT